MIPATNPPGGTAKTSITIIIASVMGAFLLLTIVIITLMTALWCRQSKFQCSSKDSEDSGQYADVADENHYDYIDLESFVSAEEWNSDEENAQNIPQGALEVDLASQASKGTSEGQLAKILEFVKDDISLREMKNHSSDQEVLLEMPAALQLSRPSIAACALVDDFEVLDGSASSSDSTGGEASECNSQEPHDYLVLIGDPEESDWQDENNASPANDCASVKHNDYLELIGDPEDPDQTAQTKITVGNNNPLQAQHDNFKFIEHPEDSEVVDVDIEADQNHVEENNAIIENEYTSLSTTNAENPYTTLGSMASNQDVTTDETGARQGNTSEESHDYLVLIADPEDSNKQEETNAVNKNDTLEEPHDYLEVTGNPEDPQVVNADIQTEEDHTEKNDAVLENEYISLSTLHNLDDMIRNSTENPYTTLGNMASNTGAPDEFGARESPTLEEPHDYLVLIADPEDSDKQDKTNTINKNDTLEEPHDYLELIEDPEKQLEVNKCPSQDCLETGYPEEKGSMNAETLDFAEQHQVEDNAGIANEYTSMSTPASGDRRSDSRVNPYTLTDNIKCCAGSEDSQEPHDYLVLLGDPEDSAQQEHRNAGSNDSTL